VEDHSGVIENRDMQGGACFELKFPLVPMMPAHLWVQTDMPGIECSGGIHG
jgi:hypothetical protein